MPVPADVAADLVVVQAARVLRALEARPVFYLLAETWTPRPAADTVLLTTGTEFTAPSPTADGITGVQQHAFLWRTAPDRSGHLTRTDTLATAYPHARDPDRQAARIRATRTVFWGAKHTRHHT
ncbi:hypothetical protein [Streptomyces sp. NPDC055140]